MKLMLRSFFSLTVLVAVIVSLVGHRFVLVATGDLSVDSYPVPAPGPIAMMRAGERAAVLSCDDLKSYPAVHVRMESGLEGYVIDVHYELITASIWDRSSEGPIVFNCPKY